MNRKTVATMRAQNSGKESPAAQESNYDVAPSNFDPSDREERRDETHERGIDAPLCDDSNPVQGIEVRDGVAEKVLKLGKVGGQDTSIAQAAAVSSADALTDNLEQETQAKQEARKVGHVPTSGSGAQSVEKDAASHLDEQLITKQKGTTPRASRWSKEQVRKRQLREDAKATGPAEVVAGAANSPELEHTNTPEDDVLSQDRLVSMKTLEDNVLAKSRARGKRPPPDDSPHAMSVLERARRIDDKMCAATAGPIAGAAQCQEPEHANSLEDNAFSHDRLVSMKTLEQDTQAKSHLRGNQQLPADAPGAVSVLARAKRIDAKMCDTTDALAKSRLHGNGPPPADSPGAIRVLARTKPIDDKLCAAKDMTQPHNPQDDAWPRSAQRDKRDESDHKVLLLRAGSDQTQGLKEEGATPGEVPTIEREGGASPRDEEHRSDASPKQPGGGDANFRDETSNIEPYERSNIGRGIVDCGTTSAPEPEYGIGEAGGSDEDEGLAIAVAVDPVEEDALMPIAIESDVDAKPALYRNRRFRLYTAGGAVLLVMLVIGVIIVVTKTVSDEDTVPPAVVSDQTSTPMPTTTTTLAPITLAEQKLMRILEAVEEVTPELISDPTSSESKAFNWMTTEDPLAMSILTTEDGNEAQGAAAAPDLVQRFLLANFFFATTNDASNWTYCGYSGDPTNENCTAPDSFGESKDMELEYPWLCQQHECEWYGVYCGEDNQTRLLSSFANNLNGTLPSNLYHLKEMQFIRMTWNDLTGTIPSEYGNMKHLINFEAIGNYLSGTIPEEIYKAEALQRVNFGDNCFTGTMSTMIGNLPSLKGMFYFDNIFDGPFPSEIGKLESLALARNGENAFTGSIPTKIGNLKKVREFWLQRCSFNGTIPAQIGGMKDLETFWVFQQHRPGLSGPLPDSLYDLSYLRKLRVNTNRLTGTISTEIGRLTDMERLTLERNQFNGTIPAELAELTKLEYLWLHFNKFDGPVPNAVCNLRAMNLWQLYADCLPFNNTDPQNPCECCSACCNNVEQKCHSEK